MYRDYQSPDDLKNVGPTTQRSWDLVPNEHRKFFHFVYQRGGVLDLDLIAAWFDVGTRQARRLADGWTPHWIRLWDAISRQSGGSFPRIWSLSARTLRVFGDPDSNIRKLKDGIKAIALLARAHYVFAHPERVYLNYEDKAELVMVSALEKLWPVFRIRRKQITVKSLALNVEITTEKDSYRVLFCPREPDHMTNDLSRWAPFLNHTGWTRSVIAFTPRIQRAAAKRLDPSQAGADIKSSRDRLKELVYGANQKTKPTQPIFSSVVTFFSVHEAHQN